MKTEDIMHETLLAKLEKINAEYKLYIAWIAETPFTSGRFSVRVSSYRDCFIDLKV